MRKRIFGKKLKRDTNQRKALFRSLMGSLVLYGKIRTTEAKAKSIKAELEKLVTLAKNKSRTNMVRDKEENARNLLLSRFSDERVVEKIISEIAPKFASRPGGYTRLTKMGPRLKDGAKMVLMTWVEEIAPTSFKQPKRKVSKVPKVLEVSKGNVKGVAKSSKKSAAKTRRKATVE